MRRRAFIALLGGAAVAWPLAARAEQAEIVGKDGHANLKAMKLFGRRRLGKCTDNIC